MSRGRLLRAGVGLVLLLVVGAFLALGPVVRAQARRVAASYGLTVEIASVRPRWLGLRLGGVGIRNLDGDTVDVRLDRVDVAVSMAGTVDEISLEGGQLRLQGTWRELADWLRSRRRVQSPGGGGGGGGQRELAMRDVSLVWAGFAGEGTRLVADGLQMDRGVGTVGARMESLVFSTDRGEAKALGLSLVTGRKEDGGLEIRELRAARVELDVQAHVPREPEGAAADTPSDGDTESAEEVAARPAWMDAIGTYRERAIRVAGLLTGLLSSAGHIESSHVVARLRRGDEQLHLGPGRLRIRREAATIVVEANAGGEGQTPLELRASIPGSEGEIAVNLQGGPVSLASLGAREGELGLVGVEQAMLDARANVAVSNDGALLSFDAEGHLASLGIHDPRLAEDAIVGLDLGWRGRGDLRADGTVLRVEEGELRLGEIRFLFEGQLERGPDFVRARGSWQMPSTPCQAMLASVPRGLIPRTADMQLGGTFAMTGRIAFDTRDVESLDLDWRVREPCRITSVPDAQSVARFRSPFRRLVYDNRGNRVEIVSGPGTPYWVPIEEFSPYLEAAVLTTEDGRFHRHSGFDKEAIKSAVKDNLKAGRFVRGASTISMQLAKNLYLDRKKTLSRKLEEVLLTAYLEQALTKAEILELYFNIVELGPMIYGIGQAAQHYFNTTPSELSLGQALFLVSTLPSPNKQYFDDEGRVSERWTKYLHRLMRIMVTRNRITEQEMLDGMSEIITLGMPVSPRREATPPADVAAGTAAEPPPVPEATP